MRVKIYLIQNFQSNLIIDMNILKRDDINFQLNKNMLIINEINVSLNYLSLILNLNNYIFFHFIIAIDIRINIKKFKK